MRPLPLPPELSLPSSPRGAPSSDCRGQTRLRRSSSARHEADVAARPATDRAARLHGEAQRAARLGRLGPPRARLGFDRVARRFSRGSAVRGRRSRARPVGRRGRLYGRAVVLDDVRGGQEQEQRRHKRESHGLPARAEPTRNRHLGDRASVRLHRAATQQRFPQPVRRRLLSLIDEGNRAVLETTLPLAQSSRVQARCRSSRRS